MFLDQALHVMDINTPSAIIKLIQVNILFDVQSKTLDLSLFYVWRVWLFKAYQSAWIRPKQAANANLKKDTQKQKADFDFGSTAEKTQSC